jgi:hypothetical protein
MNFIQRFIQSIFPDPDEREIFEREKWSCPYLSKCKDHHGCNLHNKECTFENCQKSKMPEE